VVAAVLLAIVAGVTLPRALDAGALLADQDDPAAIADHKIARLINSDLAAREIEAALAANDADLAESFLALAREHGVAVSPALTDRVVRAVEEENSPSRKAENFALGLLVGEPDDLAGFAGMALGDLFVFGDIRDAVREGARLASGQAADHLVLGLACVGLAVTAGTYATIGSGAPVRMGLTVAKAARKSGRLSADLAEWFGRALRDVVDWDKFRGAIAGATLTQPAVAIRAAREAVKLEKAGHMIDAARDVGRVQSKAGTRAALDSLKVAQSPADVARLAKLAEKKGNKTRAILKLLGRGAIVLATGIFNLLLWVVWAVFALFGFLSSTKGAVERYTLRRIQRRKQRLLAAREQEFRNRRLAAVALGQTSRA
jgi:hypothetical protein